MVFSVFCFSFSNLERLYREVLWAYNGSVGLSCLLSGIIHLGDILKCCNAFNPYYGIKLLINYPKGFYILGGVFLCTTGAEALYSDLGHCGKWNIRYSWIFVKTCLILNYLGQGAWLLSHFNGQMITTEMISARFNPFYGVMPEWFLYFGIAIATVAAIIASQALISGSFTLISEAMRLNLWPKLKNHYPTEARGQLYIPAINLFCLLVVSGSCFVFKKHRIWKLPMDWLLRFA